MLSPGDMPEEGHMSRVEEERRMTEEILMKLAPASDETLEDSIWSPKNKGQMHRVPKAANIPEWLVERLEEDGDRSSEEVVPFG